MKHSLFTVTSMLLLLALAGCTTPPTNPNPETPFETRGADVYTYDYGSAPGGQAGGGSFNTVVPGAGGVASDLGDPFGAVPGSSGVPTSSGRIVYFAFDSAELRADARALVQSHASTVAGSPGVSVLLEGHADERGTREYNIGLGEQRGNAVRRLMIASGVSPEQIQVVSYGEERPAALGGDEQSLAQNRRVEIVY